MPTRKLDTKSHSFCQIRYLAVSILLLLNPAFTFASTILPQANGLDITWPVVTGIDGINIHHADGRYIQSLAASATTWRAPAEGRYFLVSVIGNNWQDWPQSSTIFVKSDNEPVPTLNADSQGVYWQPIPDGSTNANGDPVVSLNIHSARDGQYITTLGTELGRWTPPGHGEYYMVLATTGEWLHWQRTNSVKYSAGDSIPGWPTIRVDNNQLAWPAAPANLDVIAINIHRLDGSYVASIDGDSTRFIPTEPGGYYIVATTDTHWQDWPRSEIVTIENISAPALNTDNYVELLGDALLLLRGSTHKPFIQSVLDGIRLWNPVLPSVSNVSDTRSVFLEIEEGSSSRQCDSGTVERDVIEIADMLDPREEPKLTMIMMYSNCRLGEREIHGKVEIDMLGDSPLRLGGQFHQETFRWQNMSIADGSTTISLTGSYRHEDSWSGPIRLFRTFYATGRYSIMSSVDTSRNATIYDSAYKIALDASYFGDVAEIAFVESGMLNVRDATYPLSLSMSDLTYANTETFNNGRVTVSISDSIASGQVELRYFDGSNVHVLPGDASNAIYRVINQNTDDTFSNSWLWPVQCTAVSTGLFTDYSACP